MELRSITSNEIFRGHKIKATTYFDILSAALILSNVLRGEGGGSEREKESKEKSFDVVVGKSNGRG